MAKFVVGEALLSIGAVVFILFVVVWGFRALGRMRWQTSETRVSGIVYNTKNNKWISGATSFSVRASEDTYVSEENESSFCLPHGSKYIDLVNKAAENKSIKVVVRESKVPFHLAEGVTTCVDNVTVEEVK